MFGGVGSVRESWGERKTMRETERKMGRVAQRGEGWDREREHKRHDREAVGEV